MKFAARVARMEIFGLPLHPLVVHFPVVAIPTLAILGLVMAVAPGFRKRYGVAALILGIVTTVVTFFAATTGNSLNEDLGFSDDFIGLHRRRGDLLRLFVLGLTLSLGAMFGVSRREASSRMDPLTVLTSVLVVAFAVLSTLWTVLTGHSGADAVWGF